MSADLLSDDPLFLVLTIYAIWASSLAAHYALADTLKGCAVLLKPVNWRLRKALSPSGNKALCLTGKFCPLAGRLISPFDQALP